jgi:hypothetical protein
MVLAAVVSPAAAQTGPGISGGNVTCTIPTSGADDGAAVSNGWTSLDFNSLFLASIHRWVGEASLQTPTFSLPSARAVRFASAGRTNARVTRVTNP